MLLVYKCYSVTTVEGILSLAMTVGLFAIVQCNHERSHSVTQFTNETQVSGKKHCLRQWVGGDSDSKITQTSASRLSIYVIAIDSDSCGARRSSPAIAVVMDE